MRPLGTLLFVAASVFAGVPDWSGEERLQLLGDHAQVHAARVALDPAHPARRRLGALTFLGGVHLTSPDPAFGGFSSLRVAGDRVTLLSDGGNIVRFRLRGDGRVTDAGFADLPGGPGTGWQKLDRDSESMAIDPATGKIWVGFEAANAIWRYAPGFARWERAVRPWAMRGWHANTGPESMVRRRDGSFVVIAEGRTRGPGREGLVFRGDPTVTGEPAFAFRYLPPPGASPSDATELPDGRLLVLNRLWSPPLRFGSVLVVIDPATIRPGAAVRGREIARLAAPLIHDNFEGVAATVERGRTIVWLVSDDNQLWLQRSLLLKFLLD